jgi:hypothetical protein
MKKSFIIIVAIVIVIFGKVDIAFAWRWILYHESSFKGRVIDAETKKPLEGVRMEVHYTKLMMGLEANTHDVDASSTITDKKGEFYIPSYTTLIAPWYLKNDVIQVAIHKSGYHRVFLIVPVKNINVVKSVKWRDPQNVESIEQEKIDEGIVYVQQWHEDIMEREKALLQGQGNNYYPFFPLKDAEAKVKTLEIPFEHIEKEMYSKNIEELWRVWKGTVPEPFKVYTVIGLRKLK